MTQPEETLNVDLKKELSMTKLDKEWTILYIYLAVLFTGLTCLLIWIGGEPR